MKKSFLKSSTPQNSALLLVLEQAFAPDQVKLLKQNLLSVKRRFSLHVNLLVAEPSLLFDNTELYALLKMGLFDKVQISGEGSYFYYDMLEFCKRQNEDLFFCCLLDIFAINFFDWLSFFIRNNQLQLNAEISQVPPMSVFDLAVIRETPTFFANDFFSWQQAMRKSILRQQLPRDAAEGSATFLTLTGLDRLGGLNKLKQRPLLIGGQAVNAINQFYCLTDTQGISTLDDVTLLPLFERLDDGEVLLFDINPAYSQHIAESVTTLVNVPRMILLISKVRNLPSKLDAAVVAPVSFVMSCFNKVQYLAAAWYSVVMQTYKNVELAFLDDGSSDKSLELINELSSWTSQQFMLSKDCFKNRGTYWLRNLLINRYIDEPRIYIVQDADDYSTAQRAFLQVSLIQDPRAPLLLLLADIVRTDSQYRLLELEGELERYGSATLAADVTIHRHYGYFENLRKNADTEFINRIKRFGGEVGLSWFRYPVLFQPYDGNNLTADIYTFNEQGTRLEQNIEPRTIHKELFGKRQRGLALQQLADEFGFPAQVFPGFYYEKLSDFLLNKFLGFANVTAIELHQIQAGLIDDKAGKQLDDGRFSFTLAKTKKEHSYFYSTALLPISMFHSETLPSSQRVALSFDADVEGQASIVLVYLDSNKNKIEHQFFYANQVALLQLPAEVSWIKLGIKLAGEAQMTLNQIQIGWMVNSD